MEHNDISNEKLGAFEQIKDMDKEILANLIIETIKENEPNFIPNFINFMTQIDRIIKDNKSNISKFIIQSIEAIQLFNDISPILNEFVKTIENDPKFKDMSFDELTETVEFKNFIKKYNPAPIKPDEVKALKSVITPETIETIEGFYKILQGKATNALSKVKTTNFNRVNILGNAEIKIDDTFMLRIKNYDTLKNGIPTTAHMLLDCFLIHFTEQPIKDIRIRLSLKNYMKRRGLSDTKSAREQVLRDIEVLKLIEYEAKEKIRGKWVDSGTIGIYGGTGYIRNGIIHFNFNADFYKSLSDYKIMDYSVDTLKINPKLNPHAFYFSRYIDENYRLNEGKERVNIISIATLIQKAPLLPTYEEIMQSKTHNGNIYKYIIEPVIRDLDIIERLYYDFLDTDDNIIVDPLTLFKGAGGYSDFLQSKIKICYEDYEKHTDRIIRRKKHTEKANQIKSAKTKEKEFKARITELEKSKIEG